MNLDRALLYVSVLYMGIVFLRLRMNRGMEKQAREYEAVAMSMGLLIIVFGFAFYQIATPPDIYEEWAVFDTYYSRGQTIVLTYGQGKRSFMGNHTFELDQTYQVTWHFRRFALSGNTKYGIEVILTDSTMIQGES